MTDQGKCLCTGGEIDANCPMVRVPVIGEPIGHVMECPVSGEPCPCLPGSLAHVHCSVESDEEQT